MKKHVFIISFLLLTAVFIAPLSVSAAENAGIKPGSFFYGFVTTFEKVNLFFTFNQEKKAEKAMKYAEKRLAEAEAVAGDKNSDAVKAAISGYEKSIALAAEASKKVKDETKAENLLNLIANNTSKHQQILSDVLSKVPDEAKEAITKALEASKKGQEEATQKIADLKGEVEKLKQEVAELKAKDEKQKKDNQQIPETEKPQNEIGELKKKPTSIQNQQIQTDNATIKIEKCKTERDSKRIKMLEESQKLVEEGLRKFQDQLLQQVYDSISPGAMTASEIMTTLITPQIKAKREKDMQTMTSKVDVYLNVEYAKCLNQ